MKKKSRPISKIGANESRNDTKIDCDGTSTVQPFEGGLPVSASMTVGSWRTTYEATTLLAPLIVLPDFKSSLSFCSLSISTAESTSDFEIASKACEVLICVYSFPAFVI
ncbi:unannotated protein [freshwater metagenome]|uniref:Unannotated protein n=1 Tax=freshwater metagenome TaxID=449393 RepID=A0A6J6ZDH3_9ZZZZ